MTFIYNYYIIVKKEKAACYGEQTAYKVVCKNCKTTSQILNQAIVRLSIKMERKEKIEERKEKILISYKEAKMRIALCNREINFIKKLKKTFYRYAESRRLDIVVDCYFRGEDMLESNVRYNLIFLDYYLCGKNGMEISKLLRKKNDYSAIIFISSNTEFVFDAFKVNPYRFLVPPIGERELFSVLDEFFEKYGKDYPIWIKNREDTVSINTADIYYLEADNKHCFVHLEKRGFHCNRTMARVFAVLPKYNFSKINRAFIVNMNYVVRYNSDLVYLSNGTSLHISRNYLKSFKEEYFNFLNPRLP